MMLDMSSFFFHGMRFVFAISITELISQKLNTTTDILLTQILMSVVINNNYFLSSNQQYNEDFSGGSCSCSGVELW